MEQNNAAKTIIYLMACALRGERPVIRSSQDYKMVYRLCRYHSVTAIVEPALEAGGLLSETYMEEEFWKKWLNEKNNAIRRTLLFDAEREKILEFLEKEGIWHVPLKGCILKTLYPNPGMRQMSDNDIWFDETRRAQLRDYMLEQGYSVEQYGKNNHDVYHRDPIFNFEFHVQLFAPSAHPQWSAYYEERRSVLVPEEDKKYGFRFSDEDFYVYLLLHMYKHHQYSGIGIRPLADIAVYLEKKPNLDWKCINRELDILEIRAFEEKIRTLALLLFGQEAVLSDDTAYFAYLDTLAPEFKEELQYLLGSGTYGTTENRVKKKLSEMQSDHGTIRFMTKVKFCMRRLIPDMDYFKNYVPFCYRHKWMIPFYLVYRAGRGMIKNRKNIIAELWSLKKIR